MLIRPGQEVPDKGFEESEEKMRRIIGHCLATVGCFVFAAGFADVMDWFEQEGRLGLDLQKAQVSSSTVYYIAGQGYGITLNGSALVFAPSGRVYQAVSAAINGSSEGEVISISIEKITSLVRSTSREYLRACSSQVQEKAG